MHTKHGLRLYERENVASRTNYNNWYKITKDESNQTTLSLDKRNYYQQLLSVCREKANRTICTNCKQLAPLVTSKESGQLIFIVLYANFKESLICHRSANVTLPFMDICFFGSLSFHLHPVCEVFTRVSDCLNSLQ